MKRVLLLAVSCLFLFGVSIVDAASIENEVYFKVSHSLAYPKTYKLRFSLWDSEIAGTEVWSEGDAPGAITMDVTSSKLKFYIGTLVPLDPADFNQQLWLQVDRWKEANYSWATVGSRIKVGVVPYALHSETTNGVPGSVSGVTAGEGLTGGGTIGNITINADTNYLQRRVTGFCLEGQSIRSIDPTGAVVCEDDTDTHATYSAGQGLILSSNTFSANTSVLQSRISSSCAAGSSIRAIAANGDVTCELDDSSGSGISSITAGTGLTGGGASGAVTVNADIGTGADQIASGDHSHEYPANIQIWGYNDGKKTHYSDPDFVLESTDPNNLQLKSVTPITQYFSLMYPTNCAGNSNQGADANMRYAYRQAHSTSGRVLSASFCDDGTAIYANVSKYLGVNGTKVWRFLCIKHGISAVICQQL